MQCVFFVALCCGPPVIYSKEPMCCGCVSLEPYCGMPIVSLPAVGLLPAVTLGVYHACIDLSGRLADWL